MNHLNSKTEQRFFFIFFILLWIYLWLRAVYIPFSHDEVATFFHYIHSERFIPFLNAHWYANNHVLNTILAFVFYKIFGASELVLRLPNLLFFAVFFFYTYKTAQKIKTGIWRWLFVIVLCLSHYFVEFFALCRGYGIAMASMVAAAYYLMKAVESNNSKYYAFTLLFALSASLANLTLINSMSLIIFLLAVNTILNFRKTETKKTIIQGVSLLLFGIIPLVLLAIFALELQTRGLLDVGTQDGFWQVTLKSNTKVFTGSDNPIIAWYVVLVFTLCCLFFLHLLSKKRTLKFFYNSRFVFFYLLLGNLFITLFLGTFLHVNYPEDRAAMYFFPLLIGSFCFLADDNSEFINSKIVGSLAAPLLLLPVHFFFNMNLAYTSFWKDLRIPYRYYDKIKENSTDLNRLPVIGGYRMRGFAWTFINFRKGKDMNQVQSSGYPDVDADFQFALINDRSDWLQHYDSLDYDPYSEIWLLKKKVPLSLELFETSSPVSSDNRTTNEFLNFYEVSADSLIGKSLLITCDLSFTSFCNPFVGRIVASVNNEKGETLRYEFLQLDYYHIEWNGEPHNINHSLVIHELPEDAQRIVVYYWNILGMEYSIKDAICKVEVMN